MEKRLQHISHEHPLILKAEEAKTSDGTENSDVDIKCNGCLTLILGPFYSCGECRYFLHKICAELPNVLDHPMHPQHPLTIHLEKLPNRYIYCTICRKNLKGFVYCCSTCDLDVDTICVATSRTIEDECHMHPLIPIQTPITFPCHICRKEEKSVSYKCTICSFWVHQSCTLLPKTVKYSDHPHLLTLLPSLPFENHRYSRNCDICKDKLFLSHCSYSCVRCLFHAHISCVRSETTPSSSRDQNTKIYLDLPMKQKTTEQILRFVEEYHIADRDANIDTKINHFDHEHPLILIEEQIKEKTCDACAISISPPFYGCIDCDYFLHKCCTELPKKIDHPSHPQHQLTLGSASGFFRCDFCYQRSNGFCYRCFECEDIEIDIKCASLLGPVCHEAHKKPLFPIFSSSITCSICLVDKDFILQCKTGFFNLCFRCAMAPAIMTHRYGKLQPFILTYSPPENHYNEYICEICEKNLNPKRWSYHCVYADQFSHISCMISCGADSNIKYGKSILDVNSHKHKLTFVRCTYDSFLCSYCREPLRTGLSVGLECIPCKFRVHLRCYFFRKKHIYKCSVSV